MRMDGQIDFVELPGANLLRMRYFYGVAFHWTFENRGDGYVAFEGTGVKGGISANPQSAPAEPLVVFYARDLEAMRDRVLRAGGEITRDIFFTVGGRRFHFRDPGENEIAVWSDGGCEPLQAAAQAPPSPPFEPGTALAPAIPQDLGYGPEPERLAA